MQDYTLGKLTRTRTDGSKYWSFCIVWWTTERDDEGREVPKRHRHSLDTTDRVAAEALARKVWGSLNKAGPLETVGAIVDAYLGPEDRLDPVPDAKRKREAWAAAKAYWAGLRPETIDEAVSLSYPAWRNRSVNTVRQELSLIRTALNWAAGVNKKGPRLATPIITVAPKITLPAMPETSVGHLTKTQFRQFLLGCGTPHVKLFAMLAVTTGGRKSAILEAKWDQVDFGRALFSLNADGRRQNSKYRATVPLNDMIRPALREAKQGALTEYIIEHHGEPLKDIKNGIAAASKRSGVKVHPHMFRHSAAVWMAEDRVPMSEIAEFLGHRDINVTTRVYARYHPDFLREAARSLTW